MPDAARSDAAAPGRADLAERLAAIVGAAHVRADDETRARFAEDVWRRGERPDLVVAPGSADETARVVRACAEAGVPVYPRGGGMSYTGGYLPDRPGGASLDLRRLDAVRVDPEAMTVTAGAGATWAKMREALRPHGLRTPFWGPLSGLASTLGGGLSQTNAFFGAAAHGPSSDSVLSVTAALPDGSTLATGSASAEGAKPFLRSAGPDLTGLFLGDCGALGVKVEATLRLIPEPEVTRTASFTFPGRDEAAHALAAMARVGAAAELFGFDPGLARVRLRRASLAADAASLARVVRGGGLLKGARLAAAGRGFLEAGDYSLHATVEARTRGEAAAGVKRLARAAAACGGRATATSIPDLVRAHPFAPLTSMIGPEAQRWVPVHGVVSVADGPAVWAMLEARLAAFAERFEAESVEQGCLVTTLGTTAYLIEPVFLWPEALFPLHAEAVGADHLARLSPKPENPRAGALVAEAREAVVAAFREAGAAHFQLGRTYPFMETRTAPAAALTAAIKRALDPNRILNPGALGL